MKRLPILDAGKCLMVALAVALLVGPGCADGATCDEGEVIHGGACVPAPPPADAGAPAEGSFSADAGEDGAD